MSKKWATRDYFFLLLALVFLAAATTSATAAETSLSYTIFLTVIFSCTISLSGESA
jgi:hypothetical protein